MPNTTNQVEVTLWLNKARDGDIEAQKELYQHVYRELRAAARNLLKHERSDVSMQTTTLVQEAVCRLFVGQVPDNAPNRRYLFAAANQAMRQILVDHARKPKLHGSSLPLDDVCRNFETKHGFDLERLDRALTKLGETNPRQREMIEHRFFGGLTIEQTAEIMEVSVQTVERDWRLARAKLYRELKGDEESHRRRSSRMLVKPK